jgi:hypothetical protein
MFYDAVQLEQLAPRRHSPPQSSRSLTMTACTPETVNRVRPSSPEETLDWPKALGEVRPNEARHSCGAGAARGPLFRWRARWGGQHSFRRKLRRG